MWIPLAAFAVCDYYNKRNKQMKLIEDRGDVKVYRLPANAVNLEINIKTRQVDVVCAESDEYQFVEDGKWVKVKQKRKSKRSGEEYVDVEKV